MKKPWDFWDIFVVLLEILMTLGCVSLICIGAVWITKLVELFL